MKTFKTFSLIGIFLLISNSYGQLNLTDSLDYYIKKLMVEFDVPGASIAIVTKDNPVIAKGYGTKTLNKNEPIDKNTLFAVGSITKSFTALALGMLVDEGKINWDDRVVDYIPYFKLYDPYVTNAFTIRDLLIHNSGLKKVCGGTFTYGADINRTEIIKRLKYLKPVSGFRSKPAYQNLTYIVAGEVVAVVSGLTWEEFIKTRIFKPLGMNKSVTSYSEIINSKNVATPHHKDENFKVIPVSHRNMDNLAPCGSIYSTASDMAKYMKLFLNEGVVGADTIVSQKVIAEILKPQILYPPIFSYHNKFTSYGFGWWLTPKNSNTIIEHSGGVDGMTANIHMIPELEFGAVVFNNQEEFTSILITYLLMLEALNEKNIEIYEKLKTNREKWKERTIKQHEDLVSSQIQGTHPSLNLEKYTGTFFDEMYGDIFVQCRNDELFLEFSHTHSFSGALRHWHYDTFEVDWIDPMIPNGFITFILNSKGEVTKFNIDQPRLLDVDFSELNIKKKN